MNPIKTDIKHIKRLVTFWFKQWESANIQIKKLLEEKTNIKEELYDLMSQKELKKTYNELMDYTNLLSRYRVLEKECKELCEKVLKEENSKILAKRLYKKYTK